MTTGFQHPITRMGRRYAWRILRIQLVVGAALVLLFGLIMSTAGALSALAGTFIVMVPGTLFTLFAFRVGGARFAHDVVRSFFLAEAIKWLSTLFLFVLAFSLLQGPWLPLLLTSLLMFKIQWMAPIFLNSKTS